MKALILEKQDKIENNPLILKEVPDPVPEDNQIKVKVKYCGICRTDIHTIEGDIPLKKSPIIVGHEITGEVVEMGKKVKNFKKGDPVGVSWFNGSCGKCKYCKKGKQNYCPDIKLTGWNVNGGYAEYVLVDESAAFNLNNIQLDLKKIAPLLCPGIAGYCTYKLAEIGTNEKIGLIGFGPTAYYVLKVAKYFNNEVYVSSRSKYHREEALKNGADYAENIYESKPPIKFDKAIIFPTAGELVELVLKNTESDATLVLSGVTMSEIKIKNYYKNLWGRTIKTLYQVDKKYGDEFLKLANKIDFDINIELFTMENAMEGLKKLKSGKLKGMNGVIEIK